jgi:hypothetical protein
MIARSVTGGLVPRAINSEASNPTPVFSPSAAGGPTIFVNANGAGAAAAVPAPPAPQAPAPAAPVVAPVVAPVGKLLIN